jgi:signal transduction histidine kinase
VSDATGKPGLPGLDRLAHDLRGPLAPMQTAVYLLRSGQLDDARREELHELLDRQTRRMARMIDELDDWLRATQHRLLGATGRIEPVQLLEMAMTGAGCIGGDPADIDDDSLLAAVVGDQRRIVQMLRILLEHARAHADGAVPRVRVRCDGAWLELDIVATAADAGNPATLLDAPVAHAGEDSLGLQLLVARAIAQAHEGTLDAGEEGGHLRLRCRLPLAQG